VLYVTTAGIVALGFMTHGTADSPVTQRLVEFLMAGAAIGAMALWVRANRVAIARSDEPAGSGRPLLRVVRSRRQASRLTDRPSAADRTTNIARLDPDDNVVLPYDFC
jgi:hypothetical protein